MSSDRTPPAAIASGGVLLCSLGVLPLCNCHPDFPLNPSQQHALDVLHKWTTDYGTKNLSFRLVNGDAPAKYVFNQCNYWFGNFGPLGARQRRDRPAGLEKCSGLVVACHLAGVAHESGMLRSTSYEDDLREVLRLYDAGEQLNDLALQRGPHRKLFMRTKKRAGGSWTKVFMELRKQRPGIEFRRFFGNAPDGVFVHLDGQIVLCESKEAIEMFAFDVFRTYLQGQPAQRSIARIIGEGPAELRTLYVRMLDQKMDARGIVERAAERTFPVYATHIHRLVPRHLLGDSAHPSLGSFSELVVDCALAATVPDYPHRHRHGIPLKELAPGPHDWAASPYTGSRGPVVDLLVENRLAIEVSFATERRKYVDKMAWKLARLQEAGFEAVNVKLQDGAHRCAVVLSDALARVGVQVDQDPLIEVLWSSAFEYGTKDIQKAMRDVE